MESERLRQEPISREAQGGDGKHRACSAPIRGAEMQSGTSSEGGAEAEGTSSGGSRGLCYPAPGVLHLGKPGPASHLPS